MQDASPGPGAGASAGSSGISGWLVSLSFWSREDAGCWREKEPPTRRALWPLRVHARRFLRGNSFASLSVERIIVVVPLSWLGNRPTQEYEELSERRC